MLPEVEKYFAARNASRNTYYAEREAVRENPVPEWRDDMTKEERAAYYAAATARQLAILKVQHDAREAEATAKEVLTGSDNPLIRWIATDSGALEDYPGQAEAVLRALPMDRYELEEFGYAQDWCDVFRSFLRRAEEAGVLPEDGPATFDLKPMLEDMENEYGWNRRSLARVAGMVRKHLPALLEQAKQAEAQA